MKTKAIEKLRAVRDDLQNAKDTLEADERLQCPPASVQVNAPLALIQVDLKARVQVYAYSLGLVEDALAKLEGEA